MSIQLIDYINGYAARLETPPGYTVTDATKQQFYLAIDTANEYRGEPSVLLQALDAFQHTENAALFYAGVAYVHLQAAYLQGFSYAEVGVEQARTWLDRATQMMPKIIELLLIETFIALRAKQYDQAKELITRLQERDAQNFYVLLTQLEYYGMMMAISSALPLFDRALSAATSPSQEIHVRNRIARYYVLFGKAGQAVEMYKTLTQLTPDDPWVWHNLSILYLQRYRLRKAWQCNARALKLMSFDNARQIRRSIIRQYAIVVLGGIVVAAIAVVYLISALVG